jgi:hypothetical protein
MFMGHTLCVQYKPQLQPLPNRYAGRIFSTGIAGDPPPFHHLTGNNTKISIIDQYDLLIS